jgi:hypothetical protein
MCIFFVKTNVGGEKKGGIVDMYNVGHLVEFNAYYKDL